MPCVIDNAAPTCQQYASPSKQQQLLIILLNAAQEGATFASLLEEATAEGLTCLNPAQLRAKQATMICEGLDDVDCSELACYTPLQLEAIKTLLICSMVNTANP